MKIFFPKQTELILFIWHAFCEQQRGAARKFSRNRGIHFSIGWFLTQKVPSWKEKLKKII